MNSKAEVKELVSGSACVTSPVAVKLEPIPLVDPNGWDSYDPELIHASTAASALQTKVDFAPAPTSANETSGQYPFLAPPQAPDEIGRLGPYRVLKALGEGGMGIVFEAEDPALRRLVALKTMKPEAAASPTARERFLREARATAAVKHDNVVTIHQVGEDNGVAYLAMELLQGETLEQRLKREKRLPSGEVLRIGRETAEGLAAAHEHGLIHRDIKPENIWLEGVRGRIKIVDFGLVLTVHEESNLSRTGLVVGTPAYMSPEHALGKAHDPRCDLFSLGSVLYRACTGLLPFKGATPFDMLLAITEEAPKPICLLTPDVSQAISKLVMKLLAKSPDDRFASARTLVTAIEAIESQSNGPAVAVIPPSAPSRKKHKFVVAAALAILLTAATMAAQWDSDPIPVGANTGQSVDVGGSVRDLAVTPEMGDRSTTSAEPLKTDGISPLTMDDDTPTQLAVDKRQNPDKQAEPTTEPDAKNVKDTTATLGVPPAQSITVNSTFPKPTSARLHGVGAPTGPSAVVIHPATVKPVIIWRPKPIHKPGASPHQVHPHKP